VAVDAASEASSKDDRSRTEASSIDLEWEHEEGIQTCQLQVQLNKFDVIQE
jgi:hypothetical protein